MLFTPSTHPLARWALPLLATLAGLAALWAASAFVIPLVSALAFGVLLWPAVLLLDRVLRLRALSALVAVSVTLCIAGGLVAVVGTQLSDAADELPSEASKSFAGVMLQVGVIALLTFFGLCSGEELAERMRRLCRATAARPEHCAPLLAEAARQIRLFAGVTVVTNIVIGLGVAVGFALFGVPEAWMWGLTAAVLHFVPYAGLAIVMALASLEVYVVQASLGAAVLAAAYVAMVGITVGTAMSVWLQGRAGKVDSATLFAGTVFWSVLWGGWGLMLGPLLVVVMRLAWLRAPALAQLGTAHATEPDVGLDVLPADASP